ncbi:MAG TPA: lasso peptide biosynthesis B2 protein [Longimicrobium sp.]
MTRRHAAALVGAWAALRVPFWLRGRRLQALLRPSAPARADAAVPRGALGGAMRTVALLARVPGSPWRNTCLYRSVAECLVLRRYGVPAQLRIGVKSEGEGGEIAAHAWVARPGDPALAASPGGHVPLVLRA